MYVVGSPSVFVLAGLLLQCVSFVVRVRVGWTSLAMCVVRSPSVFVMAGLLLQCVSFVVRLCSCWLDFSCNVCRW